MNKKALVVGLIVVFIAGLNSLLSQYISPEVQIPKSVAEEVATYVLSKEEKVSSQTESTYKVVKVVDGDTIDVDINGVVTRVRYIGIDTPESVIKGEVAECFGVEAALRNRELVEGKYVRLEKDMSEYDDYDRLLRHVYVEDEWVNLSLVEEGYAAVAAIEPDVSHVKDFKTAEKKAQLNNLGMWGEECSPDTES